MVVVIVVMMEVVTADEQYALRIKFICMTVFPHLISFQTSFFILKVCSPLCLSFRFAFLGSLSIIYGAFLNNSEIGNSEFPVGNQLRFEVS